MVNTEHVRRRIAILENSIRLLEERIRINSELCTVMKRHPNKVKPEYAFESDPDYNEVIKRKWENETQLQNIRLRENIRSLKEQIDVLKQELVKKQNKPKEDKVPEKPNKAKKGDKK